jgi:hypothetical protein
VPEKLMMVVATAAAAIMAARPRKLIFLSRIVLVLPSITEMMARKFE